MDNLMAISSSMSAGMFQQREKVSDLEQAAEQFEALFIQQLLKQARSAKLADDILGSEAGDTYTEMLDQERAKHMSVTMDLGIADALIGQFGNAAPKPSGK